MKIKLLPFEEAKKRSNECHKQHLNDFGDEFCIGIYKPLWKDNAVLEVIDVDDDRYLGEDGFWYRECCCEVIENEKSITVKELINYYSGKLYENDLLKVFVFNENYSNDNLITDINSILNNAVKSYDIWDYDEFMFMFCNKIDSIYFATHFNRSTRFITIKI